MSDNKKGNGELKEGPFISPLLLPHFPNSDGNDNDNDNDVFMSPNTSVLKKIKTTNEQINIT